MQTLEDFLKRRLNFGVGQRPFRRAEHQAVRHALFPGGNLRAAVNVEQLDAFRYRPPADRMAFSISATGRSSSHSRAKSRSTAGEAGKEACIRWGRRLRRTAPEAPPLPHTPARSAHIWRPRRDASRRGWPEQCRRSGQKPGARDEGTALPPRRSRLVRRTRRTDFPERPSG